MRRTYRCDWCGKEFIRHDYSTNGKKHLFCSRQCCWNYASKTKNPDHYAELKDLSGVSKHMAKLNATMNATRMTLETRTKLREFHLGKGECNGYSKIFSRLAHRVVAEQLLGRPLESEEVVHHRDGNRYNNTPENLVVFPTVGNHTRFHNEERWFIRQLKQIQEAENACSK
jgi:YHS domain-containing protein